MNNEDDDDDRSLFSILEDSIEAVDQDGFDIVHPNEAEDAAANLHPPFGVAQVAPILAPLPAAPHRQVRFAAAMAHRFDRLAVPQVPQGIAHLPVAVPQAPVVAAPPVQIAPIAAAPPAQAAPPGQIAPVAAVQAAGAPPHIGGPPQVVNVIGGPPQGVGVNPHYAGYPQAAGAQPNIGARPARGYFPQQYQPTQRYTHGPQGGNYRRFNSRINHTIGDSDPASSSGAHLYNAFTTSPFDIKTSMTPSNHVTFVAGIKLKMQQYGIKIVDIPTSGTGNIPFLPNFNMGNNHPSMDLTNYVNLLDNRSQRPSMEDVCAYASWIHNDTNGKRLARSPTDMIQRAVDPFANNNYGVVAEHKIKLRREDYALYALLANSTPADEVDRFSLYESKYRYHIEGSPNDFHYSGLTLLALMLHDASPTELLDSATLRDQLAAINMANSDNNLKSYKARIDTKVKEIEAIERTLYDKRGLEKKYFDDVGTWRQREFVHEFLNQKSAWRNGRSLLDVHEALVKVYNDLVHKNEWTDIPLDPAKQIALLTTQVNQLKQDNTALKSGIKTDAETPAKGAPSWQTTNDGPTTIHRTKKAIGGGDLLLHWCSQCGPGRMSGNPIGMYMEPFNGKPHNHAEWLEAKIARSEGNGKRKSYDGPKGPTSVADKVSSPTSFGKKARLRIGNRVVQSLTTNVSLSLDEAEKLVNEAFNSPDSPTHLKE